MKKYAYLILLMLFANVLWAQTIFQEKGKYGIKAENEVLVKPIYDKISVLQGGIEFDPETFEETDNVKSYLLEQGGLYQVVMRDDWENIFPKKGVSGILMPPKDQEIDFLIVEQKGKWGAIDLLEALGWFIEPSYEGMGYFGRDNFTAKKKGKWGMLDLEQQEAVGFEYDAIEASPIETIFQAKKNGQFKLYGWEGGEVYEMLPDVSYDSLKDAELGYLYFFREGKVGLLSLTKGIVIPAKYDKMAVGGKIMEEGDDFGFGDDWGFGNDFSSAGDSWNNAELQRVPQEHTEVTLGKLKGLFKMNEETGATEVFPAEFEDYRFKDQFSLNQFLLKKSGKWGLFSTADMALKDVKHTYSEASFSGWNIVFESENGKKGLMERNGNIILEADYDEIKQHKQHGYLLMQNGQTTYFTNIGGKYEVYQEVKTHHLFPGVIAKKNGKWGALNASMGIEHNTLPFEYDDIIPVGKSSFKVKQNGKWGLMSFSQKTGPKQLIPIIYTQTSQGFCKDIAFLTENEGKKGLFSLEGEQLAEAVYDSIGCISGSFIILQKGNDWSVLSIQQSKITMPTNLVAYQALQETNFSEYLRVKKDGKWGLIGNTQKQEVLPIQFNEISEYIRAGFVSVKQNGKWGEYKISENGVASVSIPAIYDRIEEDANLSDYRFVVKNGKYGLIGKDRKQVLPTEYDFLRYETKTSLFGKKADKTGSISLETGEMTVKTLFESQFPLKWKTEIGQTVFRTNMMLANGQIVVGSNGEARNKADAKDGLFLLDAKSGKVNHLLRPQSEGKIDVNGQAIDGNKIFFANENGKAFCYDFSGKQLWQANIDGEVENSPALADLNADGTKDAVFTTDLAKIYALDGKTGTLIWQSSLERDQYGNSYFMATPLCYDLTEDGTADVIVASGGSGGIHALNGNDGKKLWSYENASGVHASPVILDEDGGLIIVFASYGDIRILNKEGQVQRTIDFPIGLFAQPLFTPDGRLFAGIAWWDGKGNELISKQINNDNDWKEEGGIYKLPNDVPNKSLPSARISSTGIVADLLGNGKFQTAIASESGELFLLDENGDLIQSLQLPAGVEAPLFVKDIDGDGKLEILVACLDGYLYCYQTNSKGKIFHGQFRGDNLNSAVIKE